MMKIIPRVLLIATTMGLMACDSGPTGSMGFTLPDGNAEQGKANYVEFGCNSCHVNSEVPQMDAGEPAVISVT